MGLLLCMAFLRTTRCMPAQSCSYCMDISWLMTRTKGRLHSLNPMMAAKARVTMSSWVRFCLGVSSLGWPIRVGMGLRLKLRIITAHMVSTNKTTKGMPMMYPLSDKRLTIYLDISSVTNGVGSFVDNNSPNLS